MFLCNTSMKKTESKFEPFQEGLIVGTRRTKKHTLVIGFFSGMVFGSIITWLLMH